MTTNKQTRIVSTIIGLILVLAIVGYFVLAGQNKDTNTYFTEFKTSHGLVEGVKVTHKGVDIGKIEKVSFKKNEAPSIVVEMEIGDKFFVPTNAEILVRSAGPIAGNYLDFVYPTPCSEGNCAQSGHMFSSRIPDLVESKLGKDPLQSELGISKKDATEMLDTAIYKLVKSEASVIAQTQQQFKELEQQLNAVQRKLTVLNEQTKAKSERVKSNIKSFSDNIPQQKIQAVKGDVARIQSKMNALKNHTALTKISQTQNGINRLQYSMNQTLQPQLQKVSTTSKRTFANIDQLNQQLKNEDNSLTYLMHEQGLSYDIQNMMHEIDSLQYNMKHKKYYFVPFASRKRALRKLKEAQNK